MRSNCNYTFWFCSATVFWALYEYSKTEVLGIEKKANIKKDEGKKDGLEVMSSQAFMILQTVKDHREFSRKVKEVRARSPRLGRYLRQCQEPSESFYRLTKMTDRQAAHLPVKKVANTNRTSEAIIYNRISKTGSSTLLTLISGLAIKNNFLMAVLGHPTHRYFLEGQMSQLGDLVCTSKKALFSRYFFFTDLEEYGCHVKHFNLMRDPLSRFQSRYRYMREVYPHLKDPKMIQQGRNRSKDINSCIQSSHPECSYTGQLGRWHRQFEIDSQIPHFCGSTLACRTMGHPDSVQTAIANIERHYLVVGLLEEMVMTVTVLECLLPGYMGGLTKLHASTNIHKKSKHKMNVDLTEETRATMMERLAPEYQLYNYVRRRLQKQFEDCTTRK